MIQLLANECLAFDFGPSFRRFKNMGMRNLQGNIMTEMGVICLIHHAEPAYAQLPDDPKSSQLCRFGIGRGFLGAGLCGQPRSLRRRSRPYSCDRLLITGESLQVFDLLRTIASTA